MIDNILETLSDADIKEYIAEQNADMWLSTMEAHELAYV